MKKSYYFYTTFGLLILLGLIISGYIFGWTVPSTTPPGGNLASPINTGSTNQAKTGYLAVGTSTTPTYPLEVGNQLRVWGQLISKVASGTAPFVIDSPTKVTNLNADLLDGYDSADLLGGSSVLSISSINTPCTIPGGSGYFKITDICPGYEPDKVSWVESGLSDSDSDGCLESQNLPNFCIVRGNNAWVEPKYGDKVVVSLTANVTPKCGQSANVTLIWSTIGATSCSASGGWSGTKATSGVETISNITKPTDFTLSCTGTNRQLGIATATAEVKPCTRILIYMTTNSYSGALGGRAGADTKCDLGVALGCSVNRAFLSVNSSDEIQDMPTNYGIQTNIPVFWYNRFNESITKMGNNWADILDGSILASQSTGTSIAASAWSGSDSTGAYVSGYTCVGWTDGTSSNVGELGYYGSVDGTWLDYGTKGSKGCDTTQYLRCLCQL